MAREFSPQKSDQYLPTDISGITLSLTTKPTLIIGTIIDAISVKTQKYPRGTELDVKSILSWKCFQLFIFF
ncbi:hypothetical protein XBFFR1_1600002 [Xenorhabdus bovienii str. feltiae France]|nr:hypothetical protein XBFFR1_1600002 [Xenorhabdus bovienii str. feltiae France]